MITIDKIEKATQKTPNYIEKQGNSGGDGRVFASFAAIAPPLDAALSIYFSVHSTEACCVKLQNMFF